MRYPETLANFASVFFMASASLLRQDCRMSDYTIYHNPRCSKSRQTLQLLRDHEIEPDVVEYLKEPPDRTELRQMIRALGIPARDLIRRGEKLFDEVGDPGIRYSDSAAVNLLAEYPKLIERPIVMRGDRAIIGRPPEQVLELLSSDDES